MSSAWIANTAYCMSRSGVFQGSRLGPICELPEAARCKVDPEDVLGVVGIVGTVLNLLVVVLVYVYTPIWRADTQTVWMDSGWVDSEAADWSQSTCTTTTSPDLWMDRWEGGRR